MVLSSDTTEEELQAVRALICRIGTEASMLEVEEVLPKVMGYIRGCQLEMGAMRARAVIRRAEERSVRQAFQHLKGEF